jgi:hypothetical protein
LEYTGGQGQAQHVGAQSLFLTTRALTPPNTLTVRF